MGKTSFKNIIYSIVGRLGHQLVANELITQNLELLKLGREFKFLLDYPPELIGKFVKYRNLSKAQLQQDLFVLLETKFKYRGFFVEFGATNGVSLSNTFILEKDFGWSGILAEPSRYWKDGLRKYRNVQIEEKCLWSESKELLDFKETEMGSLSTLLKFSNEDTHKSNRKEGIIYKVETISLNDLLIKHNAPKFIDYISIDTEGSEYEILKNFNFESYTFGIITVEHNYTPMREKIYNLLIKNGYERKFTEYSQFDDWYIKQSNKLPSIDDT